MNCKEYIVHIYNDRTEWRNLSSRLLHREEGPAIEYIDGTKCWYLNGNLHREGGPAIEYPNGTKYWYIDNLRHREDGPAIEYCDGSLSWYLNGKFYAKKEFFEKTSKKSEPSCNNKVVEIDGKKYKLVEM